MIGSWFLFHCKTLKISCLPQWPVPTTILSWYLNFVIMHTRFLQLLWLTDCLILKSRVRACTPKLYGLQSMVNDTIKLHCSVQNVTERTGTNDVGNLGEGNTAALKGTLNLNITHTVQGSQGGLQLRQSELKDFPTEVW